jgi:polyphenol oxidase
MFHSLIPDPSIITAFSTKGESYDDSLKLAKLNNYTQVTLEQTHSSQITCINNYPENSIYIPKSDAVITPLRKISISVKTADCLPILIFHKKPIIAAIHAGRKGTQEGILKKCLVKLKKTYGISSNLNIWFGPAICKSCYEIDKNNKVHYDLIQENLVQLRSEFSPNDYTLYDANSCTNKDSELFYSYRRNKTKNRHFSHIVLV